MDLANSRIIDHLFIVRAESGDDEVAWPYAVKIIHAQLSAPMC